MPLKLATQPWTSFSSPYPDRTGAWPAFCNFWHGRSCVAVLDIIGAGVDRFFNLNSNEAVLVKPSFTYVYLHTVC